VGISDHEELFLLKEWEVFEVCFDQIADYHEDEESHQKNSFYNSVTNEVYKK
jgi:hypothetical protein